ncbi:hypothetical protein AAULR_10755 [Lacticaseibacillus rhamnosus MTCC 5462]|nr:hypothetical protein AAULR_10755 [Lacticaseibacillus rhamnosus MTCC 5462]
MIEAIDPRALLAFWMSMKHWVKGSLIKRAPTPFIRPLT